MTVIRRSRTAKGASTVNHPTGYRIFFRYLDHIRNAEDHDWLGSLLGGMSLLPDGSTADPAYESDWDDAIEKSSDRNDPYQIGMQFLKDWLAIGYIEEIGQILRDMEADKRRDLWEKAVQYVLKEQDDPYLHLMPE